MIHGQEEVQYLKVAHGGGSGGWVQVGSHATMLICVRRDDRGASI
jgi:hypothetical protein